MNFRRLTGNYTKTFLSEGDGSIYTYHHHHHHHHSLGPVHHVWWCKSSVQRYRQLTCRGWKSCPVVPQTGCIGNIQNVPLFHCFCWKCWAQVAPGGARLEETGLGVHRGEVWGSRVRQEKGLLVALKLAQVEMFFSLKTSEGGEDKPKSKSLYLIQHQSHWLNTQDCYSIPSPADSP